MTDRGQPEHASAAQELGEALRRLQRRSGRTLRALEKQVPISDSSLSRYFRGDIVPPWSVVGELCQVLGADPSEFRTLWEAADRSRPESLGEPVAPTTAQPAALPRWRRLRERLAGRWAFAAFGAAAGLTTGLFLALLALQHPSIGPLARGPAAELEDDRPSGPGEAAAQNARSRYGDAGVLVHNAQKDCQKPRTHRCSMSLAYDPYRPYTTVNSAVRVWHHDLLRARCRIADGVSVFDEDGKHSSIWIHVMWEGQSLWLPGIRVAPDNLQQLSVALPKCPS